MACSLTFLQYKEIRSVSSVLIYNRKNLSTRGYGAFTLTPLPVGSVFLCKLTVDANNSLKF